MLLENHLTMFDPESAERMRKIVPVFVENGGGMVLKGVFSQLAKQSARFSGSVNFSSADQIQCSTEFLFAVTADLDNPHKAYKYLLERADKFLSVGMGHDEHNQIGNLLTPAAGKLLGLDIRDPLYSLIRDASIQTADLAMQIEKQRQHDLSLQPFSWIAYNNLVVTHVERETADYFSLYLSSPNEYELPHYKAGQYIAVSIQLPFVQHSISRLYALSGNPSVGDYRITVNKSEGRLISDYLSSLRAGSKVGIYMPCGTFEVDYSCKQHVFVSEESGMPAVMSMLYECNTNNVCSEQVLNIQLNSCPSGHEIFRDELILLKESYPFIDEVVSPQSQALSLDVDPVCSIHRRLEEQGFSAANDTAVYISGGFLFTRKIRTVFEALGFDEQNIFCEHLDI